MGANGEPGGITREPLRLRNFCGYASRGRMGSQRSLGALRPANLAKGLGQRHAPRLLGVQTLYIDTAREPEDKTQE